MALLQHKYYVYHDAGDVFARMDDQEPILVESFDDPHQAYLKVQSIVNPTGRAADTFTEIKRDLKGEPILDANGNPKTMGYNSKEFQDAISPNCEAYVKAAYGVGKKSK